MCKFHILGVCSRGAACAFAHDRLELQPLPDLFRTKMCKVFVATGECNDEACRYAHNELELRAVPEADQKEVTPSQEGTIGDLEEPIWSPKAEDEGGAEAGSPSFVGPSSLLTPDLTSGMDGGREGAVVDSDPMYYGGGPMPMGVSALAVSQDAEDSASVASANGTKCGSGWLRPVRSAGGRLDALGKEEAQADPGAPSWIASRLSVKSPNEPMKINPGVLRSCFSSNDVARLATAAIPGEAPVSAVAAAAGHEVHGTTSMPPFIGYLDMNMAGVACGNGYVPQLDEESYWGAKQEFNEFGYPVVQPELLVDPDEWYVRQFGGLYAQFEPAHITPGRLRSIKTAEGRLDWLGEHVN